MTNYRSPGPIGVSDHKNKICRESEITDFFYQSKNLEFIHSYQNKPIGLQNSHDDTYNLHSPKVVAIAKDKYLTPTTPFADTDNLPNKVDTPKYGQDIIMVSLIKP